MSLRSRLGDALEVEQEPLAVEPAGVAADRPAAVYDAMARYHDRDRIRAERIAGSTHGGGIARPPSHVAIGDELPERDPRRRLQNAPRETAREGEVDPDVEPLPPPREVLVQLPPDRIDEPRGGED